MVIKIYENGKDDNGDNDKLPEQVAEDKQHTGYYQHPNPADVKGPKRIPVLVNII